MSQTISWGSHVKWRAQASEAETWVPPAAKEPCATCTYRVSPVKRREWTVPPKPGWLSGPPGKLFKKKLLRKISNAKSSETSESQALITSWHNFAWELPPSSPAAKASFLLPALLDSFRRTPPQGTLIDQVHNRTAELLFFPLKNHSGSQWPGWLLNFVPATKFYQHRM